MTSTAPKSRQKLWVIFLTNNRKLGEPIRLLARPKAGRWTMGRRRAAKFKTAEEATAYLKTIDRQPATTYHVAQL